MPQAYLFVSIAIDEFQPDAPQAQADIETLVDAHDGEWIHEHAAVIPAGPDAVLSQVLVDLSTINHAYDPTFTATAVYVPARQAWFSTDPLANTTALSGVTGRTPVVI